MSHIRDFWRGLSLQHVDYTTRKITEAALRPDRDND